MNDEARLYAEYEIVARNTEGEVIQERHVEPAGSITIEDIQRNAVMHQLDEFEIRVVGIEIRKDDELIQKLEPNE